MKACDSTDLDGLPEEIILLIKMVVTISCTVEFTELFKQNYFEISLKSLYIIIQ